MHAAFRSGFEKEANLRGTLGAMASIGAMATPLGAGIGAYNAREKAVQDYKKDMKEYVLPSSPHENNNDYGAEYNKEHPAVKQRQAAMNASYSAGGSITSEPEIWKHAPHADPAHVKKFVDSADKFNTTINKGMRTGAAAGGAAGAAAGAAAEGFGGMGLGALGALLKKRRKV